ncbi:zinc finger and BTB domain-containing protein 21 [Acipenser oxyrinchus oxyrinchus]|uniref:Zinc finger and BTB domain-containing protein 21 n=1 Tax=Acipenser oxyrinchus oxyrinchus TaxID=40147 RepID=A0AAD8G832_ACIOX|nr:zinc finger and BTB domain-containing protein 21 [Acipenser oxyrinchus oxyrinchus]
MEGLTHYINPAHAVSLLSSLNEQRLKGKLCDVLLIVGDHKFRAHKSVLAGSSEYFHSLFARGDGEARSVVQLDFCEPDAFEDVLNYIYSSSIVVEKDCLAAVQELGYSLGISFLTNILSKKPQALYAGSRRKAPFSEEDESGLQKRSVIVCQGRSDKPRPSSAQGKRPSPTPLADLKQFSSIKCNKTSTSQNVSESGQAWAKDSSASSGNNKERGTPASASPVRKSSGVIEGLVRMTSPATVLQMGKPIQTSPMRPQLATSFSFNDSRTLQERVQPNSTGHRDHRDHRTLAHHSSVGPHASPGRPGPDRQRIDRSGPLVKSLLRRSLSMDSPVPFHSPAFELKSMQAPEETVLRPGPEKSAEHKRVKEKPKVIQPPHRRPGVFSKPPETQVHVKTEPSSPLADPSEIIRVTVGDSLPVNLRDLQMNTEHLRNVTKHSFKRKSRADGKRTQSKKSKYVIDDGDFGMEHTRRATAPRDSDTEGGPELNETRQSRIFKCWSCLKIFRSNTGLYRHVNMYHNPEKPYSCDICHKRFHTNFKVWTHCQTQHGVVKNPAPASSSYSVLDEKFQRKLIDIVREREIKKALMAKLRRNKQGLGGSQAQHFPKRGMRPKAKNYFCVYCGKVFRFHSQFKQHVKMHPGEKPATEVDEEREEGGDGGDDLTIEQEPPTSPSPGTTQEMYPCKLCNAKLPSPVEQGDHERLCRHATVCPYCNLRFTTPELKREHEGQCEYKKLTCLECMRTFKSSFSIWRHQVEVHNQNTMTPKERLSLSPADLNGETPEEAARPEPESAEVRGARDSSTVSKDDPVLSDSSEQMHFEDSDDSLNAPEDLSLSRKLDLKIKEEPAEEAVEVVEDDEVSEPGVEPKDDAAGMEVNIWTCEKCGKIFAVRNQLERHQELLCHIKPFVCHICNKAFRTNFRLWSHFQSHMASSEELSSKEADPPHPSSASPSPPPPTPAPPQPVSPPSRVKKPEAERARRASFSSFSTPKPSDAEKSVTPQESDTLFYHAPPLSAITFKRQFMCKLCHRTFKTAFSLWSHEQSHTNV